MAEWGDFGFWIVAPGGLRGASMKWMGEILLAVVLGLALAALLTATAADGVQVRRRLPILPAVGAAGEQSAQPEVRRGEVRFAPDEKESTVVPKPFRLEAATFKYEETPQPSTVSDLRLSLLTFPSPVHTSHERNNTVHCEFFRPAGANTKAGPARYPACIVLHILGGDFPLSRAFAAALAKRNVAALFVIMPYYGPRRDPDGPARMVSADPEETVRGMTQAVKDIRYATAWLAEQPEVDPKQLGVFGISLGGITAALAGEAEPRLHKICPTLAGGDIGSILWDAKEKHLAETRRLWEAKGNSRQSLVDLLSIVDPVTYADRLKDRKLLMLNARNDEVIPRQCTESLWKAAGEPRIIWYDSGHITAAWHLFEAMQQVTDFFQPDAQTPEKAIAADKVKSADEVKAPSAHSPAVAGQRPSRSPSPGRHWRIRAALNHHRPSRPTVPRRDNVETVGPLAR